MLQIRLSSYFTNKEEEETVTESEQNEDKTQQKQKNAKLLIKSKLFGGGVGESSGGIAMREQYPDVIKVNEEVKYDEITKAYLIDLVTGVNQPINEMLELIQNDLKKRKPHLVRQLKFEKGVKMAFAIMVKFGGKLNDLARVA